MSLQYPRGVSKLVMVVRFGANSNANTPRPCDRQTREERRNTRSIRAIESPSGIRSPVLIHAVIAIARALKLSPAVEKKSIMSEESVWPP
jgi:hypothetical protein